MWSRSPPLSRLVVEGIIDRVRAYDWATFPVVDAGVPASMRFFQAGYAEHWVRTWSIDGALERWGRHRPFRTEVDGLRIHFIHERPIALSEVLPIVLLNGWPGTCHEFSRIQAAAPTGLVRRPMPEVCGRVD